MSAAFTATQAHDSIEILLASLALSENTSPKLAPDIHTEPIIILKSGVITEFETIVPFQRHIGNAKNIGNTFGMVLLKKLLVEFFDFVKSGGVGHDGKKQQKCHKNRSHCVLA